MNKLKTQLVQAFAQVPFRGFRGRAMVVSFIAASMLISLSSCEIDTLDEPDGIITGVIRDTKAADGVFWTEQPNGVQISCTDLSWTESETSGGQTFWAKADGTFRNTKVFAAQYSIRPTNGAFHSAVTQEVEVKSNQETTLVFDVIPYCSFQEVSIAKDPNTSGAVLVKFKVTTNPVADNPATEADEAISATPRHWRILATSRTPYVGNNIFDADVSTTDQTLTESQLGTLITYSKTGFKTGTTYYIRLGARCVESPQDRYNMTEIVKIEF